MNTVMLDDARREIDRINTELTRLMIARMKAVDRVAQWKAANQQPINVPAREEEIIRRMLDLAEADYAPEIEAFFRAIFEISKKREARIIGDH